MPSYFSLAAVSALVLSVSSLRAADGWETDYEKAKATAASGNEPRDILINFTGSDWCGWCIKLREGVFEKDTFKIEAPKTFVLMEADFPQEKKLPEALKTQNDKLAKAFSIEGYPTLVLTDATGRPYARAEFEEEDTPRIFLDRLADLRKQRVKRDEYFTKAAKADGLEKAKLLFEGMKELDPATIHTFYTKETSAIIELDTKDTLEVKKARDAFAASLNETAEAEARQKEEAKVLDPIGEKLEAMSKELEKMIETGDTASFEKAMDKLIADGNLTGVGKQYILMQKLGVYGPDRIDTAASVLEQVIAIDPKSSFGIEAANFKANLSEIRKQVEESKKSETDEPAEKAVPAEKAPDEAKPGESKAEENNIPVVPAKEEK